MTTDHFRKQELLTEYSDAKGFKPHLTIMKLSKAPRLRKQGWQFDFANVIYLSIYYYVSQQHVYYMYYVIIIIIIIKAIQVLMKNLK